MLFTAFGELRQSSETGKKSYNAGNNFNNMAHWLYQASQIAGSVAQMQS